MKSGYLLLLILSFSAFCVLRWKKPVFKVAVEVRDDAGKMVEGALVSTDIFDYWKPGEGFGREFYKKLTAYSARDGQALFESSTARCEMVFRAEKTGHYAGGASFKSTEKAGWHWVPWNQSIRIELKRMLNPIPLTAKKVHIGITEAMPLPADQSGYDLQIGDWTSPYGKGKVADLVFGMEGRPKGEGKGEGALYTRYDTRLRVSFSHAGDGMMLYEKDPSEGGSALKMPYEAPAEGYLPEKTWRKARLAGYGREPNQGIDRVVDETKRPENYFLRLRTVLDANGKVVSAHYAKIHGGFEWFISGKVRFQYHFNPTANDRNLEFDPSRNLLKVQAGQAVTDP